MLRDITRHQWLSLLTVQLCTILFGVTVTSVTVVLPQMKGALSATQDQIAWVLTLNLVATAVTTPMTGWLSAKLGWRRLMVASVLGFTVASAACGLADSLETLVVLRIVQGAFGAPIFPLGQSIILARFERRHHPMALMMWGVGGVMGPILGPAFGGLVADLLDWRWSFYMILPLGLIACAPTVVALGDEERGSARRFDFLGFLFIAVAVGATQLMLDRGQRLDWFDSLEIVVLLCLAAGFLYLFVVHSWFAASPLFDAATFRDRNFVVGVGFAFVMGMLQFTPMVLFPPLLQDLRDFPESIIGYLIATRGVGNFLSFLVVAQLTRRSARGTLALGLAIQAVAALWMSRLDMNLSASDVFWTNLLHGFGFGLAYTPMATLAFSTLEPRLLTQGNAIFSLLRLLGSSFFVSLSLLVVVLASAEARAVLVPHLSMFGGEALAHWVIVLGDLGGASFLSYAGEEVRRQAAMIGYLHAFLLLTAVPAAAVPAVLLFRHGAPATRA